MSHPDPLFPARPLLPLGTPTGVVPAVEHRPARLRPFSAALGRPMPVEGKKHDTVSTAPPTSMSTQRSEDGRVTPDSVPDTGSDS
jgi:hypothetical protein